MQVHVTTLRPVAACFSFVVFLFLVSTGWADALDEGEDLPATAAEIRYIESLIEQVEASVPAIRGWQREVAVTAGGNTFREDKEKLIFERARNFPLKVSIRVDFKKITEIDRQRTADYRSAAELQQELLAAGMAGDKQKMEELRLEMAAIMQRQMQTGAQASEAAKSGAAPNAKPPKFYVQVIVNGRGETIGRDYEIDVPGVVRAFRSKADADPVSYKYYIGDWSVSDRIEKNWSISAPEVDRETTDHLRALVVMAQLFGDRDSVESYREDHFDLDRIRGLVH